METSLLAGRTYLVYSFGCQMNFHDAERVRGLLDECGCIPVEDFCGADIVVFMTCCVRENASTRLYGNVSQMASAPTPPSGRRVVAIGGCIAQHEGENIRSKIPRADVVFGTRSIASLPALIENALKTEHGFAVDVEENEMFSTELPIRRETTYHAWVPIMTGCNNFCSYCIVPYVRGRERSRPLEEVRKECEQLAADGIREICLLGQNVNSYGRDLYGKPRFAELLQSIGETSIERIRFVSSHPKDLSDDTIAAIADVPAVMPQLHLAVQSGSTRILQKMNRTYTRDDYRALIERIRGAVPDIALSTDIIVGFPGETEDDFLATLSLVEEVRYDSAFTFIYSPRPNTPAARLQDTTPHAVIQKRFERLAELVQACSYESNLAAVDTTVKVLVEGISKRCSHVLTGHCEKNRTVHISLPQGHTEKDYVGKIVPVHIDTARSWYVTGTLESEHW